MKSVCIHYGAVHEVTVEEQVNRQGFTLGRYAESCQKMAEGLQICHVHRVLTNCEFDRALNRLHKIIDENLKPITKETDNEKR